MVVAKIVRCADTLTIHLPWSFDLEEVELSARKEGNTVILEPIDRAPGWERVQIWLDKPKASLDDDFIAATGEDPGPAEQRDFSLLD